MKHVSKYSMTETGNVPPGGCNICYVVIKDDKRFISPCIHAFCIPCIDEYRKQGGKICPICKIPIDKQYHVMRLSDEKIIDALILDDLGLNTDELRQQQIIMDKYDPDLKRAINESIEMQNRQLKSVLDESVASSSAQIKKKKKK